MSSIASKLLVVRIESIPSFYIFQKRRVVNSFSYIVYILIVSSGRVRVGFKVFGIRRRKACLGMPTDGGR